MILMIGFVVAIINDEGPSNEDGFVLDDKRNFVIGPPPKQKTSNLIRNLRNKKLHARMPRGNILIGNGNGPPRGGSGPIHYKDPFNPFVCDLCGNQPFL
jgi:hypothetical protein